MSVPLNVEDYLLEAPAIDLGMALAKSSSTFAAHKLRLIQQQEKFDELCRVAEAEASPGDLVAIAAHLNGFEKRLATILVPVIRSAEESIAKRPPKVASAAQKSFYRLSEEALDIASKWLEAYQNAQIRLYSLASDKLKAAGHESTEIRNADDLEVYFRGLLE